MLSIGDPVEVGIRTVNGSRFFPSRVEGMQQEELLLAAPVVGSGPLYLPVGTRLTLRFATKSARHQGRYITEALLRGVRSENILMWVVRLVGEWKRVQQRSFVRVPVRLPVRFEAKSKDTAETSSGSNRRMGQEGVLIDISGSGACLAAGMKLEEGTELTLDLELPVTERASWSGTVSGIVVRTRRNEKSSRWEYGIEFDELPTAAQDNIVRWVFARQRELRRKGVL